MNDTPRASPFTAAPAPRAAGELLARYEAELAARDFHPDPTQLSAVLRLDELRGRLMELEAVRPRPLLRFYRALVRAPHRASPRGLYLWGGVGRGKTWLMDLFFESLPFPGRRRRHFHRFMHEVHAELAQLKHTRAPLERIAAQLAAETRILCFDELYVADIADAMLLGGLFEGLFRRGVALVATSNVAPRDLYKEGLQRQRFLPAIALLERHCEVLRVAGACDYRLRQLTRTGTYLDVRSSGSAARLAALFGELADHGAQSGGSIEIEGRPIAVVRASPNVVWFDFAALCAGARSASDYIEIAREYQSVIVSAVPTFGAADDDAARRFIALVDELYDRNVKLIVSAAAAADELYRGTRLAALFERTASRLIEMQSEAYLAREHRP